MGRGGIEVDASNETSSMRKGRSLAYLPSGVHSTGKEEAAINSSLMNMLIHFRTLSVVTDLVPCVVRHFHTTYSVAQRPDHPLYVNIDWSRIDGGDIAVVDPLDNHAVLYLSERAYQVQVRVSMSHDSTLIVLARPGDRKSSDQSNQTSSTDHSQNSPLYPRSSKGRRLWSKLLQWSISRVRSQAVIREDGTAVVEPTVEILLTLLPYWGFQTSYMAGGPLAPSKSFRRAMFLLARSLATVLLNQGSKGLILKMKNAYFLLNRYLAEQEGQDSWLLGHPVGLARSGLPKLIPLVLRRRIASGDLIAIRVVGSILLGYKAFEGPHDFQMLKNIVGEHPKLDDKLLQEFEVFCKEHFWKVVQHYAGRRWEDLKRPDFNLRGESSVYVPLRAGPNHKSGFVGAPLDALAWSNAPVDWIEAWCKHTGDQRTLDLYSNVKSKSLKLQGFVKNQLHLGKIGLLPEPAGKVRTIAIVDYWTQRVMYPVHSWMMSILEVLPTDGTFNQDAALLSYSKLNLEKHWSIDLKSATDMIPLRLYEVVFKGILPEETVDLWLSLLTDRFFHVPAQQSQDSKKPNLAHTIMQDKDIMYNRGQPMGTLSSWASMSIVHHAIELFAAHKCGKDLLSFQEYRILGDDNVTGDEKVAELYREVTKGLCIPTSPAKTLEGKLFQFASQVYWKGVNISPLSLREELGIDSFSQRLEMALRGIKRGWAGSEEVIPISRFLRLLLSDRQYKKSVKEFAKGKLGVIAQSALVSAFGISGNLLKVLGLQSTGSKPFLLALANKVEALAGDRSRLASKVQVLLKEIEVSLAIRTVDSVIKEAESLISSMEQASQNFQEWKYGMSETGYLPRSYRIAKGWNEDKGGILLNIPYQRDRDCPELRWYFNSIKIPTFHEFQDKMQDAFYSKKVMSRIASRIPRGASLAIDRVYKLYNSFLGMEEVKRVKALLYVHAYHACLWPIIEDTYTPIFGSSILADVMSDFDYLEAEDDGCGMSFNEDPDTHISVSGISTPIPKVVTELRTVLSRLDSLKQGLIMLDLEVFESEWSKTIWCRVDEALDLVAKIARLPSFRSLADFVPDRDRKKVDLLREWGRRIHAMRSVMNVWPVSVDIAVDQGTFAEDGPLTSVQFAPYVVDTYGLAGKKQHEVALTSPPRVKVE